MSDPTSDISQNKKPVLTEEQVKIMLINSHYKHWGNCVFVNKPKIPNIDEGLDFLFIGNKNISYGWTICLHVRDVEDAIWRAESWCGKLQNVSIITTPMLAEVVEDMAYEAVGVYVADYINGVIDIDVFHTGLYANGDLTSTWMSFLTDEEKAHLDKIQNHSEEKTLGLLKARYRKDFNLYMEKHLRLSAKAFDDVWEQS